MSLFAFALAAPERWIDYTKISKEIHAAINDTGHSCRIWHCGESEGTIKQFVESALSEPGPVCVGYVGHGLERGWHYDHARIYSYKVLGRAVAKRKGVPTAIISDCCHAGSIVEGFNGSGFDRLNTIALTASTQGRYGLMTSDLSKMHTGRVFKSWFVDRAPFNPFDYSDNCIWGMGDNPRDWQKWWRLGPERFGPQKIDTHFFSNAP